MYDIFNDLIGILPDRYQLIIPISVLVLVLVVIFIFIKVVSK